MKTRPLLGQPVRLFLLLLAGIMGAALTAGAAPDTYDIDLKELKPAQTRSSAAAGETFDIDLKELKPAPARRDIPRKPHRTAQPAVSDPAPQSGRESSYSVRPGDNLFLILIRQYGLSNSAAERLIPEIVRRNNIRDPQRLTLGQRLIIPLAGKARTVPKSAAAAADTAAPAVPAVQAPPAATEPVREIVMETAPPCQLARTAARELGLQIPSLSPLTHPDNVSVGFDGLKMEIACNLTPAEAYTHERLLSPHGIQLLVFNGEVPPRRVVEELADRLGIDFWLADETASDELPVTYHFPAADPTEKSIRLTIRPASAAQAP